MTIIYFEMWLINRKMILAAEAGPEQLEVTGSRFQVTGWLQPEARSLTSDRV